MGWDSGLSVQTSWLEARGFRGGIAFIPVLSFAKPSATGAPSNSTLEQPCQVIWGSDSLLVEGFNKVAACAFNHTMVYMSHCFHVHINE